MGFTRKSTTANPLMSQVRRHPFAYFGLPFLSLVVLSSYALETFTQTRYDLNDTKVQAVTKEDELGMSKDRKRVDIREEYYRLNAPGGSMDTGLSASPLQATPSDGTPRAPVKSNKKFSMAATAQEDYEPVRVPRPAGVAEWGAGRAGEEVAPVGQRKTDRWV